MHANPETKKIGLSFELPDEGIQAMMLAAAMAYEAEDFADALTVYEGIAAVRPDFGRAVVGMGASLYCLGRVEEAEARYENALAINARDQEAHLYLGELVWNERGDAALAKKHLGRAFQLQPKNIYGERARLILAQIQKAKAA